MKPLPILMLVGILTFVSLACSFTINAPEIRVTTGPTRTLDLNEDAPADPASLTIGMGAGKLTISGGGSAFLSGSVRYNVDSLKPTIERDGSKLNITQKAENLPAAIGKDIVNEWDVQLGDGAPLDLTINAGAYEGTIDLTGVPLTNLSINDGASKARVVFKDLNPQSMKRLSYKTGASQVELVGLANANFEQLTFGGGAGSYTLDFTGTLMQDAKASITGGVSSTKIIVPRETRARVTVTGGLNNIDPRGTWTVNDNVYETGGSGPLLDITVDMGVGNLELISQ